MQDYLEESLEYLLLQPFVSIEIRIRIGNPGPDPGAKKLTKTKK
jgi:hypothetical protein